MNKRIAIVGGGIAGVTAAWELARLARDGAELEATLFEATNRLGGIVETIHQDGFTIECGPDGWITEKPWARDLAVELGLEHELLFSDDRARKTHILFDGRLETMPDGMRMMVPTDLAAIDASHLFSASAKQAFHDEISRSAELKAAAPHEDESIASFTRRHFGEEVLNRIAAPLLAGVLGGDVEALSAQAVLPQFVAMERIHGSLIVALRCRSAGATPAPIFTTLRSGLRTLVDRQVAEIPPAWIRRGTSVTAISSTSKGWLVRAADTFHPEPFDTVFLATPPQATRQLLMPLDPVAADLLELAGSSAIVVALGYTDVAQTLKLPPGFGLLVPPRSGNQLLACTFVDQKFRDRVPADARLLRAFFGGAPAEHLLHRTDAQLIDLAQAELTRILGPLPAPGVTHVRRWPRSLPQYTVGHLDRMSTLSSRIARLPGLTLLGNAYRGVGLPDLVRDARAAARGAAT